MTAAQWLKELKLPAEDQNLVSSAVVYLKKGAGRSLKAGGQWIYDNEIDRVEGFAPAQESTFSRSLTSTDTRWATASSTPIRRSASGC